MSLVALSWAFIAVLATGLVVAAVLERNWLAVVALVALVIVCVTVAAGAC